MNAPQQMPVGAVIQEFMGRTDLKGNEVEAFAQAYNWLEGINKGELVVMPAEAVQELQKQEAEVNRLKGLCIENEIDPEPETPEETPPEE